MGFYYSTPVDILFDYRYIIYKNVNSYSNPQFLKYLSKQKYNTLLTNYISVIQHKQIYISDKYKNILSKEEQNIKLNCWIKNLNNKLIKYYGNDESIKMLFYINLENVLTINDLFYDYKKLKLNYNHDIYI